jgi:hypothetical protein
MVGDHVRGGAAQQTGGSKNAAIGQRRRTGVVADGAFVFLIGLVVLLVDDTEARQQGCEQRAPTITESPRPGRRAGVNRSGAGPECITPTFPGNLSRKRPVVCGVRAISGTRTIAESPSCTT